MLVDHGGTEGAPVVYEDNPTLGRLFANDRKELDRFVERIFSALLIITVPIGVGAALTTKFGRREPWFEPAAA